ncbi:hypothetical protein MHW47_14555 [Streptomyces sp. OfavH-34-F]|uniref:hypothetical protein n=1 Tax=Streptomyces sp. OfavH-34-F TaxID=2917760 RepID=UPI001EF3623C|nr:hypothetical protein [Streptomyces sp. OfavH-34-F]MCG7525659.1 hypothetical protein [Streptomyces sp. OfavH-34-F]
MTKNAKIGAALVGGYLLGRTKKAKLAVGLGMFLLGKKIDLDPRRIARALAESPALGPLNDQVRKELVDATRTAATKAVTQRAGSLAESLQRRTQALGSGPAAEDEEPAEDARDTEDAPDARDTDDEPAADDETPSGDEAASDAEGGKDRDAKPKRGGSTRRRTAGTGTRKTATKTAAKSRSSASGSRSGTRRTKGGADA